MVAQHSTVLSTHLDLEMLLARGAKVADSNLPDAALPVCTDLVHQLAGRYLLRYVRANTLATYTFAAAGTSWPGTAYVTPTAYCIDELPAVLNLPPTLDTPTHVVLLDPANLTACGPRRTRWGASVEYVLPNGFTAADMVWPNWPVAIS